MPEAAVKPVDGSASATARSNEHDLLRELLVGPEIDKLERLHARVHEPASRAADLAEVLPDAIRGAKAKALRESLEPVFEKAFAHSVNKHPKVLADAIYPVIGPAIRTSIGAAIRDFAEGLNQIVEKSVSFRAIRWRIESIVSGKPFNEILLARSLLYSVEQVFLIHRKSGLLLQHVAAKDSVLKDADMISGMLTAIQDFLSDSFSEGGSELETVDAGRFKLWLIYSPKVLLVGAVGGTAPVELRKAFRKALDGIEKSLQARIDNFKQDDLSVFEPARPFLEACLLGQSAPQRKSAKLWPYMVAVAVVLLALLAWRINTQARWNRYFDMAKQQPGIVITGIEKSGPSWVVSGLKDPQASDPAGAPGPVRFAWQPYLSLNTPYAVNRELESAVAGIRKQIIRFDSNSSKLVIAEADRIDELALAIGSLLKLRPGAKVDLQGHADDTGSPETNGKLSLDRAKQVEDALVAHGIPQAALAPAGLGNTKPLRSGNSDWDRATNRSVSFEIQ
ncbi:MAG TPA: OmpA family protein [Bryobacteraceae bacterium]|jgi:OOP family OmpA-OmpF porin|nr:OmpA family protein [Bryobacteraceae bacterium]